MIFDRIRRRKKNKMVMKIKEPELPNLPEVPKPVKKEVVDDKSKKETKTIYRVVKELPVQPVRQYKDDDDNTVVLLTVEEALEMDLNKEN